MTWSASSPFFRHLFSFRHGQRCLFPGPDRALALGAQSQLDRLTADGHPVGMQVWSANDIYPILGKADQIAVLNALAAKGTAISLLYHRWLFYHARSYPANRL